MVLKSFTFFLILFTLLSCEQGKITVKNEQKDTTAPLFNVSVSIDPNVILEGQQAEVTVTLSEAISSDTNFSWELRNTSDVLATTADFLQVSGSETFIAGELTKKFLINSVSGSVVSGLNHFKIHLSLLDYSKQVSITVADADLSTTTPVAVLYDLPLTGHTALNVRVGGIGVESYRYKFGDNTLDCSDASTFSAPALISVKLTDAIGSDGNKKLCVLGVDQNGNEQLLATEHSWIKTSITPTLAISSPSSASFVNSTNTSAFAINGTCNSDGINNITLEGSAAPVTTSCTSGLWSASLDFSAADEGAVFVLIKLTDSTTGNVGQVIRSFTKSTNLPSIAITSPVANSYINNGNKASFTVSGTCDVLSATPNIVISGGTSNVSATCNGTTWTANLAFADETTADITIEATITNPAGSTLTDTLALKLDTENPVVAISTLATTYINSLNQGAFTVTGTCSDIGTNNLAIRNGSSVVMETIDCTGSGWTADLDFSAGYSEGNQSISISLIDVAGNPASASRTFVKSTIVPDIAITSPLAGTTVHKGNRHAFKVSGTCDLDQAGIVITGGTSDASTLCDGTTWSADLVFADEVASISVNIVATISDEAGNSSSDTLNVTHDTQSPVVAFATPEENSFVNNSTMGAFPVTGFCMEPGTGNVTLEDAANVVLKTTDCSGSGTWSTTLNLSSFGDGPHTITVLQVVSSVTYSESRTFIKDSVLPVIALTNLVNGVCVSDTNKDSYSIQGSCTNGDGDVTISSSKISSSQAASCVAGAFSGNVDIVTTGMTDREDFVIDISQADSAGNTTISSLTLKNITTAPTISFGGWDDVYAIGKKTYVDGNSSEPGVVRIKWKEWSSPNTCSPEGVKVYRASSPGQAFTSRTLVSAAGGVAPVSRSYTDTTLSELDYNKGWYYSLKLLIAGNEYEVTAPTAIDEIRVIAPPDNMALVHRWITNQEVCGLISSPTDPENNYRCPFEGQGKVDVAGTGYHDMQHDLLVDRFELGCKVSTTCGASEDTQCVSNNFSGVTNPSAGAGIPGAINSVFYSSGGECWHKNGPLSTNWTSVAYSTPSDQGISVTNEAHSPPLGNLLKDDFSNSCNGQSVTLSQILEYPDNSMNAPILNKRLLRQKEWRAAAAWSRESYPFAYPSIAEWIDNLEKSNFLAGDTSLRTGKCNTNVNKPNLSAIDRSFLSDFDIADNAFETGSKVATEDCMSRYGLQDMVGNLQEVVSDELSCAGLTCTGQTSLEDPDNTHMLGFDFDGVEGPGGAAVTSWGLKHGSAGASYFNAVLGLPLVANLPGSVAVGTWNTFNYFSNDHFALDIDGANPVRNLFLGGFWAYGESSQYGRWSTVWNLGPVAAGLHMGTRCMAPVN